MRIMKPHVSIPWLRVLVEPYLKCEQYTCVLIKGKEKKGVFVPYLLF